MALAAHLSPRPSLNQTLPLFLAGLLVALAGASVAGAQGLGGASERVSWTAVVEPASVAPGETARLVLRAEIDDGWKMYAMDSPPPTRGVRPQLTDLPTGLSHAQDFAQSEPTEGYDPNFKKDVRYFEKRATLRTDLAVGASASPGEKEVGGSVEFMVCDPEKCLPPTKKRFTATLNVEAGASSSAGESAPEASSPEKAAQDAGGAATTSPDTAVASGPALDSTTAAGLAPSGGASGTGDESAGEAAASEAAAGGATDSNRAGGWWGFLLLAGGAGLAALLTPCVFPMIPLTVSYFTKHSGSRGESVRMALVYGGTIVATFTGLGVAAALVVGAAGAQTIAANPWVNLFIGLVFIFFALSLLGFFELRLPSGLLNYFNRQSNEATGYAGVFFMGLTLTLVSFSCTVPFVGGLLAATAGGAWSRPILGMLVFSAVFSLPFVVFALFPRGLGALPKSGQWMSTLKVVLGFVELAAALKFLSNADLVFGTGLLSRPLAVAVAVVLFFLTGLYLLGKLRLAHEPPAEAVGAGRLMAAVAFFGLSLYLLPGLFGAPLGPWDAYLPPRQATDPALLAAQPVSTDGSADGSENNERFAWHTDDRAAAFRAARQSGQPVFIDFTGYTCTNCRDMEANVFPKPQVAQRLKEDFVLLRLYTDDPQTGRRFQRYQLGLTGTTALPTYAVVLPPKNQDGEGQLLVKISGMTPVEEFAAFLERGKAAHAARQSSGETPLAAR